MRFVETSDASEFLSRVHASRALHRPWVAPPEDERQFAAYLTRMNRRTDFGFVVVGQPAGELIGVINLTNIVRGSFQSGYLGYYAFHGFSGRGLMRRGLELVIRYAFHQLRLHRLEANIQPGNSASLALARRCGFQREGYSPRYLKIAGRWRDHERWALVRSERRSPRS